jgi:hypothetical protein
MESFDSTKTGLKSILADVEKGKIQLPDFQRGWVWDDNRIKGVLASVAKSFPIGAIMLLEMGNESVRFKTQSIEGAPKPDQDVKPDYLILDGQQRITSLYQTIIANQVVKTKNEKKYEIKRWYYIDMKKAMNGDFDLEEAIISINEDKKITKNIGRDIILDLSKPEYEYENLMYPVHMVDEYSDWRGEFNAYWDYDKEKIKFWDAFEKKIISSINNYQIPVIILKKENPKEAVCQVFEKVNTGGVSLNVFELLTATFAADDYDLKEKWESIKKRLRNYQNLKNVTGTDIIQSVTLISTYRKRQQTLINSESEEKIPAVNCKRKDMLNLTLSEFKNNVDNILDGFIKASKLLVEANIFKARDLPYGTQLIPMAAILAVIGHKINDMSYKSKLMQWYWSGVLGELYGSANETRYALDLPQVVDWLNGLDKIPNTIYDANFSPSRLHTLRTRNSAAYKGIYALLLGEGAFDWLNGTSITIQNYFEESVDIHHIFPKNWCEKQGLNRDDYDCIINKTPLAASTNRYIGGENPSNYLARLEKRLQNSAEQLADIMESHLVDIKDLRSDDFYSFFNNRKESILIKIEKAMNKKIIRDAANEENGEYLGDDYEETE